MCSMLGGKTKRQPSLHEVAGRPGHTPKKIMKNTQGPGERDGDIPGRKMLRAASMENDKHRDKGKT